MQRQLLHTHFGIEITVSFRLVSTLYGSYFFIPHQACGNCGYYKGEEVIKKG